MPWAPELFSAPALAAIWRTTSGTPLGSVPYFDGLMAGEPDALVESFAGEPELHDPVRGRIRGSAAFEAFVTETERGSSSATPRSSDVEHVIARASAASRRSCSTSTATAAGSSFRSRSSPTIGADGRIDELRVYFSNWPLTGRHANRPPLLQPDPDAAPVGRRRRVPACARGRRPRRDRGGLRARRLRPRARGRPARPPRPGRPARVLRAAVLQRRRHPAGALRAHRRRARLRARVQRRPLGRDRAAAAGRGRRLRPG